MNFFFYGNLFSFLSFEDTQSIPTFPIMSALAAAVNRQTERLASLTKGVVEPVAKENEEAKEAKDNEEAELPKAKEAKENEEAELPKAKEAEKEAAAKEEAARLAAEEAEKEAKIAELAKEAKEAKEAEEKAAEEKFRKLALSNPVEYHSILRSYPTFEEQIPTIKLLIMRTQIKRP